MTGINRIGGGARPEGPQGPDGPKRAKGEAVPFAGKLDSVQPTAAPGASADAAFPTLRDRILQGVDADLERDQILDNIVADEVQRTFGASGNEEMAQSVADSFRGNDQLWTLFNRLYNAALASRG